VGVDRGCLDVIVAEELLDRPDVVAVLQQMGGEAMAEGVIAGVVGNPRRSGKDVATSGVGVQQTADSSACNL